MKSLAWNLPRDTTTNYNQSIGKFKFESPPTYFIIVDFLDLKNEPPDPVKLGVQLADLHKNTISPNGMYGFPVTTYDGKWPQVVGWDSSWASFFSKMLIGALQLDVVTNGPWKELEDIVDQTVKDVIPLLLGFLETGGRSIKPCLIHGDLWEGNIGTDSETDRLYVYDAACYYAHNEMELGMWRINHHNLIVGKYRKEYRKNMEASKPKTQWDDRNRLYSCKAKLLLSASVPKSRFRSQSVPQVKI